ncbi:uncharacterized protein STEHIDRAFT_163843 [Stereum hirsutum FP-91666 SS1]|uniref:Uncharacterized protein n=1 Tax=Stereum hirsutum (strain FP-91666) TaxID=721885 RepID=R7RVV3_STEHR|nr:uncharacterized protein STEHIDRAFT_163843 [Stereum hirsutum FP-91666 SS1]EIM79324.1 hypothetical protein STEHIDRAFT_163843 [Stereum hirsutum FP-91666 SS1]
MAPLTSDLAPSAQTTSSVVSSEPQPASNSTSETPQVGATPANNERAIPATTSKRDLPLASSSTVAKAPSSVSKPSIDPAMVSRVAAKIRSRYAQPTKPLLVEDKGEVSEPSTTEPHVQTPSGTGGAGDTSDLGGIFAPTALVRPSDQPRDVAATHTSTMLRAEPMGGASSSDHAALLPPSANRDTFDPGNADRPPCSVPVTPARFRASRFTFASTLLTVTTSPPNVPGPSSNGHHDFCPNGHLTFESQSRIPMPIFMTPTKAASGANAIPIGRATPAKPHRDIFHGLPTPIATPMRHANGGQRLGHDHRLAKTKRRADELDDDEVEQRLVKRQKKKGKRFDRNGTLQQLPLTLSHAISPVTTSGANAARPQGEPSRPKRLADEMEDGEIEDDDEPVVKRQRPTGDSGLADRSENRASNGSSSSKSSSTRNQLPTPQSSPVKRPSDSTTGSTSG